MLDKILEMIANALLGTGIIGGGILLTIITLILTIIFIYVVLLFIWMFPLFLIVRFIFHVNTRFFTWLKVYTIGFFGMFAIGFIYNSFSMVIFFLLIYLIVCGIMKHFKKNKG